MGRPRGSMKVAARIGEGLRREIGRSRRERKDGRRLAHHTPRLKIPVWWRRAVPPWALPYWRRRRRRVVLGICGACRGRPDYCPTNSKAQETPHTIHLACYDMMLLTCVMLTYTLALSHPCCTCYDMLWRRVSCSYTLALSHPHDHGRVPQASSQRTPPSRGPRRTKVRGQAEHLRHIRLRKDQGARLRVGGAIGDHDLLFGRRRMGRVILRAW